MKKDKKEAEAAADAAAKAQEAASKKKGISLNPEDLAEYHTLRATANTEAGEERKKLEGLNREMKKLGDQLRTLQDKMEQAEGKKGTLSDEASGLSEKVDAVSCCWLQRFVAIPQADVS